MRWIRANRRAGSAIALLALFFQLTIALTHSHIHAHAALHDAVAVSVADASSAQPADDHSDHPQGRAGCDVCILLHATGVADLAVRPVLETPFAVSAIRPSLTAAHPAILPRTLRPRSRAPPAA
jgi:hypothetical protein